MLRKRPQQPGKPKLRRQPQMRRRVQAAYVAAPPRARVAQSARRRQRRQQANRLRSTAGLLQRIIFNARWISLGLLALTIYALAQIGLNEYFYLTQIPVDGVATVPPAEIVAASGLAGKHVFAVEPELAAAAIREVPGIISATVTLAWPNQVHIAVVEDSPVVVWQQDGETLWVSEHGRVFPARGMSMPGLLTIVSEVESKREEERPATAIVIDPLISLTEEARAAQAELEASQAEERISDLPLQFVPEDVLDGALTLRQLRPELQKLYYRPAGGLSFDDERGWRVYVGVGRDMAQKLVVYESIVEYLQNYGLNPVYVSVSNQTRPYYKIVVPEAEQEQDGE